MIKYKGQVNFLKWQYKTNIYLLSKTRQTTKRALPLGTIKAYTEREEQELKHFNILTLWERMTIINFRLNKRCGVTTKPNTGSITRNPAEVSPMEQTQ